MSEKSPNKGVKKKAGKGIPFSLKWMIWAFPKIERIFPAIAHRWFVKLFFTPFRYPIPPAEKEIISRAEKNDRDSREPADTSLRLGHGANGIVFTWLVGQGRTIQAFCACV